MYMKAGCYLFFTLHRWERFVSKNFTVKSTPVVSGACDKYNLIGFVPRRTRFADGTTSSVNSRNERKSPRESLGISSLNGTCFQDGEC
jgi:hypothetical protein